MKFEGSFILGYNQLGRRTVTPDAGHYSNGTMFLPNGDSAIVAVVPGLLEITGSSTGGVLGILLCQPEGVDIVAGDSIDLTCGTIRIDVTAYESARLDEISRNGSSTMCDLSAVLNSQQNKSITGRGCILELVQVAR